jgi:hypothetical protein
MAFPARAAAVGAAMHLPPTVVTSYLARLARGWVSSERMNQQSKAQAQAS